MTHGHTEINGTSMPLGSSFHGQAPRPSGRRERRGQARRGRFTNWPADDVVGRMKSPLSAISLISEKEGSWFDEKHVPK